MDELAKARRRLAAVIAAGRPQKTRWPIYCRNGRVRYVQGVLEPSKSLLEDLKEQATALGWEVARLERQRGSLAPRIAPKVSQIKPSLRPDRQARTPRTGRWGFGLTPAYQGRRTAPAELLQDALEWSNSTLEEIPLPCLKEEPWKEHKTSGWFAPKGKRSKGKPRRATRHEMLAWGEEQRAIAVADERKKNGSE
jgi:hypothetical protein